MIAATGRRSAARTAAARPVELDLPAALVPVAPFLGDGRDDDEVPRSRSDL
jgi:hypothetical protein